VRYGYICTEVMLRRMLRLGAYKIEPVLPRRDFGDTCIHVLMHPAINQAFLVLDDS